MTLGMFTVSLGFVKSERSVSYLCFTSDFIFNYVYSIRF